MQNDVTAEWGDRDLDRAIWTGVLIGIPLLFVIVIGLSALADLALWQAVGVAVLPAAFVGPYIGGLFAMGAEAAKHERAEVVAHVPERPEAFEDEELAA